VSTFKKILLSLIVIGALGSVTAHRTYALFTTESVNAGSSAGSGTLTFNTKVGTRTACMSWNGTDKTNKDAGCANSLFDGTTLAWPGQTQTANVTIQNDGSLSPTALKVWMSSCGSVNSTGPPVHLGGDPCASGVELYIQEKTTNTFAVDRQCWFPNANTTCGAYGTVAAFRANYGAAPGLSLFSTGANAITGPPAKGVPNTASERYFQIGIRFSPTANTNLQGEAITFPLTWHMDS
jgi:hypothetical protein